MTKHGCRTMDESGAGGIKGSTRSYCDPLGSRNKNRHEGGGGGARLRRLGQPRGQATHGEVGQHPLCRAIDNEGARATTGRQPCGQAPTVTSSGGERMGRLTVRAWIPSSWAIARARARERETSRGYGIEEAWAARESACVWQNHFELYQFAGEGKTGAAARRRVVAKGEGASGGVEWGLESSGRSSGTSNCGAGDRRAGKTAAVAQHSSSRAGG